MAFGAPEYNGSLEDKTLPPPPPEGNLEVVIRTMASDLDLLQKSGGVLGANAGGTTLSVSSQGAVKQTSQPAAAPRDRSPYIIWGIVFVVGTIILFLTGYYLIPLVLNGLNGSGDSNNGAVTGATSTKPTGNTGQPTGGTGAVTPTPQPALTTHTSFLKTPLPVVTLNLYANSLPPDRAAFIRALELQAASTSSGAGGNSSAVEVVSLGTQSRPLKWTDLTALLGASNLDSAFLTSHFSADYTMMAQRNHGKLYPGYIFKLNSGENPLLLQREVLEFENNPAAFGKLFLTDPGVPVGGFKDTQLSGQPTRTLVFSTPSSTLMYGWFFNTYLIMSTSENGLRTIIESL